MEQHEPRATHGSSGGQAEPQGQPDDSGRQSLHQAPAPGQPEAVDAAGKQSMPESNGQPAEQHDPLPENQEPDEAECIICGETKSAGIRICQQFICEECEAEIVRTDALDVRYPFFINRMKRIWYKASS